MSPNGDCAYELMCIWQTIHQIRRFGRQIPTAVIDGSIPSQQIVAMRNAIADEQEKQISNGNTALQTLIVQSLIDWSRSPMENNGRNAEVQVALQSLPPGATENEWFYSPDELDLHSALLRTGQSEVFAESGEMEAFSLMLQVPLAIYLPGYTELYPSQYHSGPIMRITLLESATAIITSLLYREDGFKTSRGNTKVCCGCFQNNSPSLLTARNVPFTLLRILRKAYSPSLCRP